MYIALIPIYTSKPISNTENTHYQFLDRSKVEDCGGYLERLYGVYLGLIYSICPILRPI
jgi:hypothetical protein